MERIARKISDLREEIQFEASPLERAVFSLLVVADAFLFGAAIASAIG